MDRPALDEKEMDARHHLVAITKEMLEKKLTFIEGASKILALKDNIGGVSDGDIDFDAFVAIVSETDHLPLHEQRDLWSSSALAKLESEFYKRELWASKFATEACQNLITRFSIRG